MLDIPYLLSIHNVLNVPPQLKIKWREIWAPRWTGYWSTPSNPGIRESGHLEAQNSLHLIFFLWGYIKKTVYAEKIRNIQHLQERITSAIETNTRHDSENVAGDKILFGCLQSYKRCTY